MIATKRMWKTRAEQTRVAVITFAAPKLLSFLHGVGWFKRKIWSIMKHPGFVIPIFIVAFVGVMGFAMDYTLGRPYRVASIGRLQSYANNPCVFNQAKEFIAKQTQVLTNRDLDGFIESCENGLVWQKQAEALKGPVK